VKQNIIHFQIHQLYKETTDQKKKRQHTNSQNNQIKCVLQLETNIVNTVYEKQSGCENE